MAVKDGKKIILTDAVEEAKKNKPHESIKEAAQDVFGDIPSVLNETFRQAREKYPGDFFIEILLKPNKFALNALHPKFNVTYTCPNPHYCQTVFHYRNGSNGLKLLWVLPTQHQAAFYRLEPEAFIDQAENVQYLLDHDKGKLQAIADSFNKKEIKIK